MPQAAVIVLLVLLVATPASAAATPARAWPAFDAFVQRYVSDDGRVIDPIDDRQVTTSEGQAYALFFALVADDRPLFSRLLRWTHDNLAGGDLAARLPAWRWGRHDDGRWAVLDDNAASDADLWLAWTLLEAGERWRDRGYRVLGKSLAARILREETAEVPGLGLSLLPGPVGFVPAPDRWRLNPSYAAPWLPLRLADSDAHHRDEWQAIGDASQRLLLGSAGNGYAPDWALYDAGQGFIRDDNNGRIGSYDAIRTYLWAGLMADDSRRAAQLAALHGMAGPGLPPRVVRLADGQRDGDGPVGFAAALIPYQRALGQHEAAAALRRHVDIAGWPLDGYYDSVLALFGTAADDGRYCFDAGGRLRLGPGEGCAASH